MQISYIVKSELYRLDLTNTAHCKSVSLTIIISPFMQGLTVHSKFMKSIWLIISFIIVLLVDERLVHSISLGWFTQSVLAGSLNLSVTESNFKALMSSL